MSTEYQRLPKSIRQIVGLDIITSEDLVEIENSAGALSVADCLDLIMVDVAELSKFEMYVITAIHKRGRAKRVEDAVNNLFLTMKMRNGGPSALEYLKKMSGEFVVEATTTGSGGFSFNVNLEGTKNEE